MTIPFFAPVGPGQCLWATREFAGPKPQLRGCNPLQTRLIEDVFSCAAKAGKALKPGELKTKASRNQAEFNQWCVDNKEPDIQIKEPFVDPLDFAVGMILKLKLAWKQLGKVTEIVPPGTSDLKPAFDVQVKPSSVRVFETGDPDSPLVRLACKGKRYVLARMSDKPVKDWTTLFVPPDVSKLAPCARFAQVRLPMLDVKTKPDTKWLMQLEVMCGGVPGHITEAHQTLLFQMDEKGVKAETAASMKTSFESVCVPKTVEFNRPFDIWLLDPDIPYPLFYGRAGTEVWAEPE